MKSSDGSSQLSASLDSSGRDTDEDDATIVGEIKIYNICMGVISRADPGAGKGTKLGEQTDRQTKLGKHILVIFEAAIITS